MDFITEDDLDLITNNAKKEVSDDIFDELKVVYEKLNFLCERLKEKGYDCSIRKDPRKQAGPGKFVFQEYQWARVYPSGFFQYCENKLSYVIGLSDSLHFHMMGLKEYQNLPASLSANKECWTEIDISKSDYESVVRDFIKFDQSYRSLLVDTAIALGITEVQKIKSENNMNDILDVLRAKKQIILQGPPGTGKTKLAKELAIELTRPSQITIQDIKRIVKPGSIVYSINDNLPYKVVVVDESGISLQLENGNMQRRNYNHIIDSYSNLIRKKPLTGGDAYQAAIAKYVLSCFDSRLIKVVQFHPSYTYEDLIRGIVAVPNGGQIEYKNVNKVLGLLAEEALENHQLSQSNNSGTQQDNWVRDNFNEFKDSIDSEIVAKQYLLTDTVGIFKVDDDCFRYGSDWEHSSRLNFTDIRSLIRAVLNGTLDINQSTISKDLNTHAHYRATYYLSLLRKFFDRYQYMPTSEVHIINNYVLIIDEINRANLSSVLGELIYAMEYRGEQVESMYAIEGKRGLVLPPNLYIIGTMNTADRNIGHIDYAIRRRFAFVDVLPKNLSTELGSKFYNNLFALIAGLFDSNISPEFDKKSVQIGHSYFIENQDKSGNMKMRLEYEIKPILLEYVKDGILVGEVNGVSVRNYILSLSL
jgi:hypothetical protein